MKQRSMIAAIMVAAIAVIGVIGAGCLGDGEDANTVYWLSIAPIDQKAQLQAGIIDGAIAWEPYASDALLSGSAIIYKWSDDIWPNHPCCVVAVDQDYLEDNEELVLRVLKAHMVATDWISETMLDPDSDNYTKLLQIGAGFAERNESVVESSLQHMDLLYEITDDFLDQMENITQKYIDLALIENQTLSDRGYDGVEDFVSSYTDDSYLQQASSIEPSETILNPEEPVRMGYLVGDLHHFAYAVAINDTIWGEGGKDLFEVYGVSTMVSEGGPYANGGFEMDAFASGSVDIGYLGNPPAILKHLNTGVDTLIIAQANTIGSAIFVEPGITSLEDFGGKTIATPGPSSIQHLMFLDYFTQNGFEVKAK